MGIMLSIVMVAMALNVLMMIRNILVYQIRHKAIWEDYPKFKSGDGYGTMMLDLRKWTYKQFYGGK